MRKRAAPTIAFALTFFGLGQSMSGWQSPLIGVALMVVGGLVGIATLAEWMRPRWAAVDSAYNYFGIGSSTEHRLADELEWNAEHARRMLRTIESGYGYSLFEPNTPALDPNVADIANEASSWATSVSEILREEGRSLDAREFTMPDEIDPEEVIADHVDEMLSVLLKKLEIIIRELREQPR
jgi:hypothetical protein